MAMKMRVGDFVSSSAKYTNPYRPLKMAPIIYMRRRPMRSDKWPATGTHRKPRIAAVTIPDRSRSRDIPSTRVP